MTQAPFYVILAGGLIGLQYVLLEVLLNPIISDSFGFADKDSTFFFLIILCTAPVINTIIL